MHCESNDTFGEYEFGHSAELQLDKQHFNTRGGCGDFFLVFWLTSINLSLCRKFCHLLIHVPVSSCGQRM